LEQKRAWDTGAEPEAFSIAGTGKQVRDILYVDDAIEIYRRAYEKRETIAGEVFNVGGGTANSLSLLELFELLSQRLGLPAARCLRYTRTPRRQSDQDVFVADVRKADQMLGWRPRVSSQEGVHRMLDWTLSCGQEEPGC
jgi:CDP-paratose 2-epimerase